MNIGQQVTGRRFLSQCHTRTNQYHRSWYGCSSDSPLHFHYYDSSWDIENLVLLFILNKGRKINYYVFVPDVRKECCLSLMHFSSSMPMRFPQTHLMFFPSWMLKSSMILSFQQRHNFPLPIFTYLKIFRLHLWHLITSMQNRHFLKNRKKICLYSVFFFYH